jgi:hypothetical protein
MRTELCATISQYRRVALRDFSLCLRYSRNGVGHRSRCGRRLALLFPRYAGHPRRLEGPKLGKPIYDLEIVSDNGQPSLRLRSNASNSTISRDLRPLVDLKETPVLQWSWKVMTLPRGGHACQKSTDDEADQVYVVWLRAPEAPENPSALIALDRFG